MIQVSRILHPTDFSDNSKSALHYASDFARQFNAELHLISVVDTKSLTGAIAGPEFFPADFIQDYIKDTENQLNDLIFEGMQHCRKIVLNVVTGTVFVGIIDYARDAKIDLIVMGTHGRSGIKHLLIGSVAENVVRKSPYPVLTVHPVDKKRGKS